MRPTRGSSPSQLVSRCAPPYSSHVRETNWSLGQQPALQGLRAVAVLMVIAFHLGQVRGGWLGVELFFVLSGFLITILLLAELSRSGAVSLPAFYARRAGRLAPALFATAAASTLFAVTTGTFAGPVARGAVLSIFYIANWGAATGDDYGALQHTWSLNIEEQFYFLWPLLVIAAASRRGPSIVVWLATFGFLISTTIRTFLIHHSPEAWFDRVYYATDTRAAALMIGAAAGAALFRSGGSLSNSIPVPVLLGSAALVSIGLLQMAAESEVVWWLGVPIFDVAMSILLIGIVGKKNTLTSMLSWRPLTYVGDISYGLYLWQGPVIFFASYLLTATAPRMAVQIFVPFLLAIASYHLLEQPIRRRVNDRVAKRSHRQSREP